MAKNGCTLHHRLLAKVPWMLHNASICTLWLPFLQLLKMLRSDNRSCYISVVRLLVMYTNSVLLIQCTDTFSCRLNYIGLIWYLKHVLSYFHLFLEMSVPKSSVGLYFTCNLHCASVFMCCILMLENMLLIMLTINKWNYCLLYFC